MSRGKLRYKLMLELLLGILKIEMSEPQFEATMQLLATSYKLSIKEETEEEWKSFSNGVKESWVM